MHRLAPCAAAAALALPGVASAAPCVTPGRLTLRLPRDLASVHVHVDARAVHIRRGDGRLVADIDLRGHPAGTVRVWITGRTHAGRAVRGARTLRLCAARP